MDSKHSIGLVFAFLGVLTVCNSRAAYGAPAIDPCSLLTQSQVSAVFGMNVEAGQRLAPKLCQWSAPNQPNSMNAKKVTVDLLTAQAFAFAKTPIVRSVTTIPASGIGDDAVYSTLPGVTPGLGTSLGFPDKAKAMAIEKTVALEIVSKL